MAMACQGLRGDLVIFSSMFRGVCVALYCVLMRGILKGKTGRERQT